MSEALVLDIPEDQLRKIEALYKDKNKQDCKNSPDKRTSLKLKHPSRDNIITHTKEELTLFETLLSYFQNPDKHLDLIDEFAEKRRIEFLKDLKRKLPHEDYKSFLACLTPEKLAEGCKLQEEGKFHSCHYIIVDGCIAAFLQKKLKDDEKEYQEKFEYEVGEPIISNLLQTHKSNPYTNRAKRFSIVLRFCDDTFNKYLKRLYLRECDEIASILTRTPLFKEIAHSELKKVVAYCSTRRFRYNELIYEEDDPVSQLFLILEGEVEIGYEKQDKNRHKEQKSVLAPLITPSHYKLTYPANDKKEFKVVRVGRQELFGMEAYQVFGENHYQHHARVTSDQLKILAIGLDVLYEIYLQHPVLEANLRTYLQRINEVHSSLLLKSQNITMLAPQKKKKRKKKLKRRTQISMEWWGLAAKIQDSKKYKLPTPPKVISEKNLRRKEPLALPQRTSKLDYFKKRLFEEDIEGLEEVQEKENQELSHSPALIPKLHKVKIKMVSSKPKVVNNADRVKKKLLQYAKNPDIFCDKLQFE